MSSDPSIPSTSEALARQGRVLAGRTLESLFTDHADRFAQHSLVWEQWLVDFS
jgi:hypothetical protein